jgi:diguanylate cyclase
MELDVRTMMVLFAMLALMFSALLALARLHAGTIQGVHQWALANLFLGLGLGLAYFFSTRTPLTKFAVVLGAIFIATSVALQFTGIQSFKESPRHNRLAALFVVIVGLQTFWFEFVQPDIAVRSILNSIALALGYAACARVLLIHIAPPLRTAFWFTGLSFATLSVALLLRAIAISQSQLETYGLYADTPLNPGLFLLGCMVQLCVTFGFLLMLNYRLLAEIQKIASRDMLTGAFNRRRIEEEAARLKARCTRTGDILAVMLIDVDKFKIINDTHGHAAGDEVLRRLTDTAQASIRADDYFARYGGDEFCILLPSTSAVEACIVAERLLLAYASITTGIAGKPIESTISIGIADSSQVGLDFKALIKAADLALYRAKQEGCNKAVLYRAS